MKKKLAMLLALVLAFGGTSAALLTSCKPTDNPGTNEQESEYKVRFLKEDGTLIEMSEKGQAKLKEELKNFNLL